MCLCILYWRVYLLEYVYRYHHLFFIFLFSGKNKYHSVWTIQQYYLFAIVVVFTLIIFGSVSHTLHKWEGSLQSCDWAKCIARDIPSPKCGAVYVSHIVIEWTTRYIGRMRGSGTTTCILSLAFWKWTCGGVMWRRDICAMTYGKLMYA